VSAVAGILRFEVLRFAAAPVSADVALVELEGRFRAPSRRRLGVPRLVAEGRDGIREVAPTTADEAIAEPEGAAWRATYAIAVELLGDGPFLLGVGRELLVELPTPDLVDGSTDREVRLAREANALRRTADEARAAAAAALASVAQERGAREASEAETAEARMARDDLSRRAGALEEELAQVRRDHAGELVRRDEEREAALAARDVQAAEIADERVADVEAEAAEARRALKAARAETEAVRRQLERERERAEALEAAVPRGRVTAYDGEPIEGEPVPERPTTRIGADADEALAAARRDAEHPADQDDDGPAEEDTAASEAVWRSPAVADDEASTLIFTRDDDARTTVHVGDADDATEAVRVLGAARRQRPNGSGPPPEMFPGSAEIGARHIEPGTTVGRSAGVWIGRIVAFAALAVAILALLAVLRAF
jgi:hypothetical protein